MSLNPVKVDDTRSWFLKASEDMKAAGALFALTPPLVDSCAFHCQQSIEKSMKGFLFWNSVLFRRTHDLNALAQSCVSLDPVLDPLLAKTTSLSRFAVDHRYPGPLVHPSPSKVKDMIDLAELVFKELCGRLPFPIT